MQFLSLQLPIIEFCCLIFDRSLLVDVFRLIVFFPFDVSYIKRLNKTKNMSTVRRDKNKRFRDKVKINVGTILIHKSYTCEQASKCVVGCIIKEASQAESEALNANSNWFF